MKKNSILLYAITLLIAFCCTPSVMAKKITYLGHYYKGKVKNNIPEGEGGILIADVAASGTFNANNITNAKIEEDWIKITGEISFDESDRITVKAGSNISSTVYLSSTMKSIRTEEDLKKGFGVVSYVFQKTLEKDSIVDLASTHADFSVSTKVYELAPYPPTIMSQIHAELVPIEVSYDVKVPTIGGGYTRQTEKRQTKIYKIEKSIEDTEYRLDNYKDKFGRIWNVSGPKTKWLRCAGKVTYPNGSYIKADEEGSVSEWEINYPNGFVLKYNSGEGKRVIYSDGTIINFTTSVDNIDKHLSYYISSTTINREELCDIIFPKSQISKLSSKEIEKLINEKISKAFANYKYSEHLSNGKKWKGLYVCDGDEKSEIGKYHSDDGVYISNKEQAAKDNAVAKKQAAKEQAAYNQLCKQYGKKYADAAVNGRIIVGMPEELMKKLYYCVLRYQSASRKKYDSADARAIIWVTNGRVSSISYY